MKNLSFYQRVVILFVSFICLIIFSSNGYTAQLKNEEVRFIFDWKIPSMYAGYFVALQKGFYKNEGLDVIFEDGVNANTNIYLVANRKVVMATAQAPSLVRAVLKGLPVISVAAITQSRQDVILTLEENKIRRAIDLKGRKFGVIFGTALEDTFKVLCKKLKFKDKEVKLVNAVDGAMLLVSSKIDACLSATYGSWIPAVKRLGKKPFIIDLNQYGIDWYGSIIIANKEVAQQNPELIKRFIKASLMGWKYVLKNKDEAVRIVLKYKPEVDVNELRNSLEEIVMVIDSPKIKGHSIGFQTKENWDSLQNDLFSCGIIDNIVLPESFFTNEFLLADE